MKRVIFIVYSTVIFITGICAFAFREQLNINAYSLFPVIVLAINTLLGVLFVKKIAYFMGDRVSLFDMKYKREQNGDGKLEIVDHYKSGRYQKERTAFGYAFLIAGALSIPFIFFFSNNVKLVSVALFVVIRLIGKLFTLCINILEVRDESKRLNGENIQYQKELEEQKKREEMGQWK